MVQITLEHLASTQKISLDLEDKLESLKKKVEELYSIPTYEQVLTMDNRTINSSVKSLNEIGVKDGSTIFIRRVNKPRREQNNGSSMDLSSLMSSPMVKGMLKSPGTIESIQEIFPELKEELMENKTLSMICSSGDLEEEMSRLAVDKDYLNTQMRNADLTMAKMENIPGGISMMNRMIKDINDPLKYLIKPSELVNEVSMPKEKIRDTIPGTSRSNPLVEYRQQMSELREIGFKNTVENVEILDSVSGDLEKAVEILIQRHYKDG